MTRSAGTLATTALALACATAFAASTAAASNAPRALWFEANRGQAAPELRFLGRVQGAPFGVTDDGLVLAVGSRAVRLAWVGGAGTPVAAEPLASRSHYLRGNDPQQWRRDVPHFARVEQRAVWPGVDVALREGDGQLEYDFHVAPGADPARIALRFDGADAVEIAPDGALRIHAGGAVLVQRAPFVFQEDHGARVAIESRYVRRGAREIGVALAGFDAARPLVVDPVIHYATALGGPGMDKAFDVAVDAAGAAYVAGEMKSATGFATPGGIQTNLSGESDAFVAKLSPNGVLVYATYLGGSGADSAWSIAVDADGAIHVSGRTSSDDFPTATPIQPTRAGGADAFVAKLSPSGDALEYATYLGGSGNDNAEAIAVGPAGKSVVKGVTESTDFPLANAAVPVFGGERDAFVAQLAVDGQSLEWSTYFGGSDAEDPDETGVGVAVTPDDGVVVCGTTESADLPIANAMQPLFAGGTRDGYVAKLDAAGAIEFSTYVGRGGGDTLRSVAVDDEGAIYLGGASRSFNFPLMRPVQAAKSVHYDAVILKLDPTGQQILFSTYLGGDAADAVRSIAVDPKRNVYVHGQTLSSDFPQLAQILGQHTGLIDDFVAKFGPAGSLIYSSRIAGSANESLFPDNIGIAVDANGQVVLAGATSSFDFLMVNAHDASVEAFDAYAMRLSATPEILLTVGGTQASPTFSVELRNLGASAVDGQVKVFSVATPGATPVAVDLGTSPLGTVASGAIVPLVTNRALPGTFPPERVLTARWLDRVTGQLLSEAVCGGSSCP